MMYQCDLDQYKENVQKAKKLWGLDFEKEVKEKIFPDQFERLEPQSQKILFYGLNPHFYQKTKNWLLKDKSRDIYFLEDDIENLHAFLKSPFFNEILNHPQVKICYLNDKDSSIRKLAYELCYLKIQLLKCPSKKEDDFLDLKKQIDIFFYAVDLIVGDFSDFKTLNLQNILTNLLHIDKIIKIQNFKDKFKDVPAIICGAGPSLEKNISLLKNFQNRALIFAGGTAINILSENKVSFHLGALIDKTSDRFKNISFNFPSFFQLHIDPKNSSSLRCPILLPASDDYPLQNMILEALNLKQTPIDLGWTVSTALVATAHFLGCSPIIFLGVDLSFKNKKYAPCSIKEDVRRDERICVKDIYGKDLFSKKDWLLARDWLEDCKIENLYNANEGGIMIENIQQKCLKDFSFEERPIQHIIDDLWHSSEKVPIDKNRVKDMILNLKDGFLNCLSLCDKKLSQDLSLKDFDSLESFDEKSFLEKSFLDKSSNLKNCSISSFLFLHLKFLWNLFLPMMKREFLKVDSSLEIDKIICINELIFFKSVCEKYLPMLDGLIKKI